MNNLRNLIKRIVLEVAAPSYVIDEDALMAVTEFVGANEPLSAQHLRDLHPFVKRYTNLYRLWQHHESDVSLAILEAEAASRSYFSATRDINAIPEMMQNLGTSSDAPAITKFDGEGFDPYEVIRHGLEQYPDHPEKDFMRLTIRSYTYQKEVVVTKLTSRQVKISLSDD